MPIINKFNSFNESTDSNLYKNIQDAFSELIDEGYMVK